MIKEIKFSGYTTNPSDYQCPDGSLSSSFDLINEDGQLNPIFHPKTKLYLDKSTKVLCIHKVANQTNYLILRDGTLLWMPEPIDDSTDMDATPISRFESIAGVSIMGNIIVVASSQGIEYILWKDGAYHAIGSRPPFAEILFGCQLVHTLDKEETLAIPAERLRDRTVPADTDETSNAVYGLMLPEIADITKSGYFYMPFFVRYAYRLYEGSYLWHSAPILMLPSVTIPKVLVTSTDTVDSGKLNVRSKLDIPCFRLVYMIHQALDLSHWKDLIQSIDIFVTAPVYTYDQSAKITRISDTRSLLLRGYSDYDSSLHTDRGRDNPAQVPGNIFIGHYAPAGSTQYTDHLQSTAPESQSAWELSPNPNFHEQIKSCNCGNFYKVASIPIDSIVQMAEPKPLPLTSTDLDNLVSRERLVDDYNSHHGIAANVAVSYNSRLCLSDISLIPPVPFSLDACAQISSLDSSEYRRTIEIEVYTRSAGVICRSVNPSAGQWDVNNHFPRYIYYPDSSAYKMNLRYDGQDHFLDLVPHEYLNGAYYYSTLAENPTPLSFAPAETFTPVQSAHLPSKIYVSQVNNPFLFPPSGIVTVSGGTVLGLAAATKPLSQGQFGKFPLYAFTTEGVWSLSVSDTGTFSATQPVTREVCTDHTSITPIDSSILFATDRGIMLIAGSESRCISDSIYHYSPFDLLSLPHFDKILHSVPRISKCLPIPPFSDFMSDCKFVYDYSHRRLYIGNPAFSFSYVFSFVSGMWGMISASIVDTVSSYPRAMALITDSADSPCRLVDFSESHGAPSSCGLLVSRPISLDYPDLLKTIDTIIIRGVFPKQHIHSILYGSRDLRHWHIVASSQDHYLRGFRGTPYKYFRIACITSLASDESILGASIQFSPRLTDHPR